MLLNGALFKSKLWIDTSDCIQYVHPFPVNSLENEEGNETDFQFLRYKCMSD